MNLKMPSLQRFTWQTLIFHEKIPKSYQSQYLKKKHYQHKVLINTFGLICYKICLKKNFFLKTALTYSS